MKRLPFVFGMFSAIGLCQLGCKHSPGDGGAQTTSTGLQSVSEKPGPREKEPIRNQIRRLITASGSGPLLPETKEASAALFAALRGQPQKGVTIESEREIDAGQAGVMVDVEYDDPAAFESFSRSTFENPDSPFRQWAHGAGRTSLALTDKGRLTSAWFFLAQQQKIGNEGKRQWKVAGVAK